MSISVNDYVGRKKSGAGSSGERFCSTTCKDLWITDGVRCSGFRGRINSAVDAAIRRAKKLQSRASNFEQLPPDLDPSDVLTITQDTLNAAWIAATATSDANMVQLTDMELEIARFVASALVQMYLHKTELSTIPTSAENTSSLLPRESILHLQQNELPHTRQRPYILAAHIRIYRFLRVALSSMLRHAPDMFGDCDGAAGGWVRAVLSRDAGNSFGIREHFPERDGANDGEPESEQEKEMFGWGLWVDASFFNHSMPDSLVTNSPAAIDQTQLQAVLPT